MAEIIHLPIPRESPFGEKYAKYPWLRPDALQEIEARKDELGFDARTFKQQADVVVHFDTYLEGFRGPTTSVAGLAGEYDIDDLIAIYRSGNRNMNRGRLYELLPSIIGKKFAKEHATSMSNAEAGEKADEYVKNIMTTMDHWLNVTDGFDRMLQKVIEAGIVR